MVFFKIKMSRPYLKASFLGLFIYTILGTSKQCAIGPTAISSALMVDFIMRPSEWPADPRYHGTSSPYLATLLAAIMGTILASLGLLQLGFLVNFISSYVFHYNYNLCINPHINDRNNSFRSVVAGFIQAAAFTIPLGQLKKIFGVHVDGQTFFTKVGFEFIGHVSPPDTF